jgi:hypothetical protein
MSPTARITERRLVDALRYIGIAVDYDHGDPIVVLESPDENWRPLGECAAISVAALARTLEFI